jgi:hypothetical protein
MGNFINSNTEKLLLVIPLYKIKQHMSETNINNNLFNTYENMCKLSSCSYLKYNNNIEIRILENDDKNEMENFGDMFKDITKKMLDIHFIEKRNVLYVESDTLCFDKITLENINKLLMFNMGTGICDLYSYNKMMNSGIIYIPKNCTIDYDFTLDLFNNCNFNIWINFERFCNILYHKQFLNFEESIKYNKYMGKYNFFKTHDIQSEYIRNIRSIDFFIENKPSIFHICGSKGSEKCLNIMNNLTHYNMKELEEINLLYNNLPTL